MKHDYFCFFLTVIHLSRDPCFHKNSEGSGNAIRLHRKQQPVDNNLQPWSFSQDKSEDKPQTKVFPHSRDVRVIRDLHHVCFTFLHLQGEKCVPSSGFLQSHQTHNFTDCHIFDTHDHLLYCTGSHTTIKLSLQHKDWTQVALVSTEIHLIWGNHSLLRDLYLEGAGWIQRWKLIKRELRCRHAPCCQFVSTTDWKLINKW